MTTDQIAKAALNTTPQQAFDEAMRELLVRARCYPKWLSEGKISHTDCESRFNAQARIVVMLSMQDGVTINANSDSTAWKPF